MSNIKTERTREDIIRWTRSQRYGSKSRCQQCSRKRTDASEKEGWGERRILILWETETANIPS